VLALVFALVAGVAIGLMDASRGFDATGVTVVALLVAGAIATLLEGSGSLLRAVVLIVLIGGWIPGFESQSLPSSAAALLFAGIGGFAGAWSARLRGTEAEL
jgi:di/tricarboxylate transporter